jgi:hypothetical protein
LGKAAILLFQHSHESRWMGIAEFIIGPAKGRTRWLHPRYGPRQRHCEEHLRRSNPGRHVMPWIASRSLSSGARSRDPVARNDDVRRTSIISDFQKLSLTLDPNHLLIPCHPVPREGALAIVTDVGAGSGGRRCAFDEQRVRRTAKSCGPDAPMAGVKFLGSSRFLGATVTSKLWSRRGEHEDKP